MLEYSSHRHRGVDSPPIDARDLTGPAVIAIDSLSSGVFSQPTVLQRGTFTLAANTAFVSFPQLYTSASGNIVVLVTPQATNPQYVTSLGGATSAVSGFTVSGSGTDSGYWLSVGYK